MRLGLTEWWATKSGGDKIVWAIIVIAFLLYFTGNLPMNLEPNVR